MAVNPQFAATPVVGSAVLSATADSSYTAPTHSVTIVSAAPVSVASVTTTSGSALCTVAGSFQTLQPNPAPAIGWQVFGTGITPGSTVLQVSGGNCVLSIPATASGTVTLTFACPGIKIDEIDAYGTGTTVAGMCQLYLFDGTNYHAFQTIAVVVVTPSATTAPYGAGIPYDFLEIPSGWSLVASSFVASQLLNLVAFGNSL